MISTTDKGNAFRDTVVSILEAAGFVAQTEVRANFKKVDARWLSEGIDGPVIHLVETKDYAGALSKTECIEFITEYDALIAEGHGEKAWLISKGPISPDGRALVDARPNLKAFTFEEFQRRIMGIDRYLRELLASYDASKITDWYVPPHDELGVSLEQTVNEWLCEDSALPLAIVAGYGKGKSTFAKTLAANLARSALTDQSRRVPVLVPLDYIVDENSLEGLLGKVFASGPLTYNYNFGLFEKLNAAGRFVVIFDGFDEMKHGMTLPKFESMISELMRLDRDDAKIVILGRDTAFDDEYEFRSIIKGRQRTSGGQEVQAANRRPFKPIGVRDFTLEEAKSFVQRFFPQAAYEALRGQGKPPDELWLSERTAELLGGEFNELLVRPVHAQMLCQIATDRSLSLRGLSKFRLFDLFVHFLLDREVKKKGRDQKFSLEVRRRFNRSLALWLWEQGGISTVTLSSVPKDLCERASASISHDYDEIGLRKELTAGCLIEKANSGTIYFGHRSLQEFLVAEEMIATDLCGSVASANKNASLSLLGSATPEVTEFILDAISSDPSRSKTVERWLDILIDLRHRDVPRAAIRFFVDVLTAASTIHLPNDPEPWFDWLRYFVANGATEFAPRTAKAADELVSIFKSRIAEESVPAAGALLLMAHVLAEKTTETERALPALLASWLPIQKLRDAIQASRKLKNDHYYVSDEKDVALWAFLHATEVSPSPQEIVVRLYVLRKQIMSILPMGIAGGEFLESASIGLPVQSLYRAWTARESDLEKVRPYFGDRALRSRILPLAIVRKAAAQSAPVQGKPRFAKLRLKDKHI